MSLPATFPLPWRAVPLTQNQLRRMHYQVEAKAKAALIGEARTAIRRAGIQPVGCANFTLHYQPGTRRRIDADGLAPVAKVVLDALVKEGVLHDDSWVEVPRASIQIHPPQPGATAAFWAELTAVEEGN